MFLSTRAWLLVPWQVLSVYCQLTDCALPPLLPPALSPSAVRHWWKSGVPLTEPRHQLPRMITLLEPLGWDEDVQVWMQSGWAPLIGPRIRFSMMLPTILVLSPKNLMPSTSSSPKLIPVMWLPWIVLPTPSDQMPACRPPSTRKFLTVTLLDWIKIPGTVCRWPS